MSLTKVTYSMVSGAPGNVLDHGTNTTPGTTNMAPAINAAIAAHDDVYIPEGIYNITSTILVPAGKRVRGAGAGTRIKSSLSSGVAAFTVGNPANNVLSYGCGVSDLNIEPPTANTGTIGILAYSTVGARFANIEVQSDVNIGTIGFKLDGGYSAFFNVLDNFLCNHCHIGYWITTTGVSYPTCQTFIGCSSFGDANAGDATSIGFKFEVVATNSCGTDSTIIGGNMEWCGTGVEVIDFNKLTVIGLRNENNTVDIQGGAFTSNCAFIGCRNIGTVDTLATTNGGYGRNSFFACDGAAGIVNTVGTKTVMEAFDATDTPLAIVGFPAQTAALQQYKNSGGSVLCEVLADGNVCVGGPTGTANTTTIKGISSLTVGAAGGASALPATPLGYMVFDKDGTTVKVPYYSA
jgi:hypothetical protein